jgi:uncharacterized membrane protein
MLERPCAGPRTDAWHARCSDAVAQHSPSWRTKQQKELYMELCILKFSGTHDADRAVQDVLEAQADGQPWLHEVGVVRRPLIGKISISATYEDDSTDVKQGEIASDVEDAGAMTGYLIGSLVGPLHAEMAALEGSMQARGLGEALEDKLLHVDDIKQVLPRGSSALVLVASPEINDQLVETFKEWSPEVIRRDVAEEVAQRLHALEQRTRTMQQEA